MLDVTPNARGYENVMSGKTYISHNVTNFEFLYEPFYVSKDVAPIHDERFMGYGYTRNTQVNINLFSNHCHHLYDDSICNFTSQIN